MILEATHSHLYPGHVGRIAGLARIADLPVDSDCLVEFADGSAAPARISRSGQGWQLRTEAYRTAAGTVIGEKLWLISLEEDDEQVAFRIIVKAKEKNSVSDENPFD